MRRRRRRRPDHGDHCATTTTTAAATTCNADAHDTRLQSQRHTDRRTLSWTPAGPGNVTIYRNGIVISTGLNDGAHTDNLNRRGGGTYVYKVCTGGFAGRLFERVNGGLLAASTIADLPLSPASS